MSDADRPDSFKKWGKDLGYTDEQLITFLGDIDSGKKTIKDMDTHIESASKTTSKFGKATSTLKNVGGIDRKSVV